jgi:molecular chaperone DnaK
MTTAIVGIDLGTTYSALATMNVAGRPEITENQEGDKSTTSAVLFEAADSITVGQHAVDAGEPEHLERWFKQKMGDQSWVTNPHFGKSYSAVDLSAMVMKKVIKDAEHTLGSITKAVITVPAYFDEIRRKATMDAAKLAGLDVLSIINEPTAAALAYATSGRVTGRVLIFDLGGGTFDVSLVNIHSAEHVEVLTSEGDNELGGHIIDETLAKAFAKQFEMEHGETLVLKDGKGRRPTIDGHNLAEAAERIKRMLSSRDRVNNHPFISTSGKTILISTTREEFNEKIATHIKQTELLVDLVLKNTDLSPSDVDHVLLVGGSTRIPLVQETLEKKFNKPAVRSINPDEAVAMGAAIKAAQILVEQGEASLPDPVKEILGRSQFTDVANSSYGTLAIFSEYGTEQLRNDIIIAKNSPLPCEVCKPYFTLSDGQTFVDVSVTQGEDRDPNFVNIIWEEKMELPPGRPSGCQLDVTYRYDMNQRMRCNVLDCVSGQIKSFDLDLGGGGGGPDLDDSDFDDLIIL